jgi:hypothetical protein
VDHRISAPFPLAIRRPITPSPKCTKVLRRRGDGKIFSTPCSCCGISGGNQSGSSFGHVSHFRQGTCSFGRGLGTIIMDRDLSRLLAAGQKRRLTCLNIQTSIYQSHWRASVLALLRSSPILSSSPTAFLTLLHKLIYMDATVLRLRNFRQNSHAPASSVNRSRFFVPRRQPVPP